MPNYFGSGYGVILTCDSVIDNKRWSFTDPDYTLDLFSCDLPDGYSTSTSLDTSMNVLSKFILSTSAFVPLENVFKEYNYIQMVSTNIVSDLPNYLRECF